MSSSSTCMPSIARNAAVIAGSFARRARYASRSARVSMGVRAPADPAAIARSRDARWRARARVLLQVTRGHRWASASSVTSSVRSSLRSRFALRGTFVEAAIPTIATPPSTRRGTSTCPNGAAAEVAAPQQGVGVQVDDGQPAVHIASPARHVVRTGLEDAVAASFDVRTRRHRERRRRPGMRRRTRLPPLRSRRRGSGAPPLGGHRRSMSSPTSIARQAGGRRVSRPG